MRLVLIVNKNGVNGLSISCKCVVSELLHVHLQFITCSQAVHLIDLELIIRSNISIF
ncbi:unnamed protein product [Spodoptera exigua]|nr:unnamed protein product [Spodoptera exigua]